jgi:hypothetical protein
LPAFSASDNLLSQFVGENRRSNSLKIEIYHDKMEMMVERSGAEQSQEDETKLSKL